MEKGNAPAKMVGRDGEVMMERMRSRSGELYACAVLVFWREKAKKLKVILTLRMFRSILSPVRLENGL